MSAPQRSMITPQQIEQIAFSRATFGGYDMQSVDALLEPLTEDYLTLYKENALLKSKMRILVAKLEEYRNNEASMKDAIVNAQKTCDMMVKEAEAKCAQMLGEASATAIENAKNSDALIAEEEARVNEARQVAAEKIEQLEEELRSCLQALERIKTSNRPLPTAAPQVSQEQEEDDRDAYTDAVADEISANLAAIVGTTNDIPTKAEPYHPKSETTTGKFQGLDKHFGDAARGNN